MNVRVYVDFEATGRVPQLEHIIQIGATSRVGEKTYEFEELARPKKHVSDEICTITGLNRGDIEMASPVDAVLERFFQFLSGIPAESLTLVAYNGFAYDFPLLYHNCIKYGLSYSTMVTRCRILQHQDPLIWLRKQAKHACMLRTRSGRASFKLGDVYEAMFSERFDDAHTALADARAMARVCEEPEHVKGMFGEIPSGTLYTMFTTVFVCNMREAARTNATNTGRAKKKKTRSTAAPPAMILSSAMSNPLLEHLRSFPHQD